MSEENWLKKQILATKAESKSWSAWKKDAFRNEVARGTAASSAETSKVDDTKKSDS